MNISVAILSSDFCSMVFTDIAKYQVLILCAFWGQLRKYDILHGLFETMPKFVDRFIFKKVAVSQPYSNVMSV